jgi:hypothetical protein
MMQKKQLPEEYYNAIHAKVQVYKSILQEENSDLLICRKKYRIMETRPTLWGKERKRYQYRKPKRV